jgi:CheY-like chemotaxis protein
MGQKEKIEIFVVDDDPLMGSMLANSLRKLNYDDFEVEVVSYETGEECLADIHSNPAAIVLDHYLDSEIPNAKSGLQILREIRKSNQSVPIFVLSGQAEMVTTAELLKAGANEYVVKDNDAFMRISGLVQKVINDKIRKRKNIFRWQVAVTLSVIVLLIFIAIRSNTQ